MMARILDLAALIGLLEQVEYAALFKALDELGVHGPEYSRFKKEYIGGTYRTDPDFSDRLRAFLQQQKFEQTVGNTGSNSGKKSVLFVCSAPDGLNRLDFGYELKRIQTALGAGKIREQFMDIKIEPGMQSADFVRVMLLHRPNFLHFTMHASKSEGMFFQKEDRQRDPITPEELKAMFQILKDENYQPETIILSACNSLAHANALQPFAKYVVGMKDFIADYHAITYADAFYRMIFNGNSVPSAHKDAIRILKEKELTASGSILVHEIPVFIESI